GVPGVGGAQPDASPRSGALSWPELETLVSDVYTSQGYSIEKAARGRDGGIDIVLRRGGERFFVQCRHWQPRPLD
uniref:restriction endonuclease n=1 Tax=Salmonella enterica TaxID=28901 RepID=UPI003296EAAD